MEATFKLSCFGAIPAQRWESMVKDEGTKETDEVEDKGGYSKHRVITPGGHQDRKQSKIYVSEQGVWV